MRRLFPYLTLLLLLIACGACTEDPFLPEEDIATSSVQNTELAEEYRQLLERVNELRAAGCQCGNTDHAPAPALAWNELLADAARRHSEDMHQNDELTHAGTDGSNSGQRIAEAGYEWRTYGENIAWNYLSAEAVFTGWRNSPDHCRNLMNPNFTEMGAARVEAYYVQTLAAAR